MLLILAILSLIKSQYIGSNFSVEKCEKIPLRKGEIALTEMEEHKTFDTAVPGILRRGPPVDR